MILPLLQTCKHTEGWHIDSNHFSAQYSIIYIICKTVLCFDTVWFGVIILRKT